MKVLVLSDGEFWPDGPGFATRDAFVRLLLQFEDPEISITLACRCSTESQANGERFVAIEREDRLKFEPLPYFRDNMDAARRAWSLWPRYRRRLRRLVSDADVVVIRIPFFAGSLAARIAKQLGRPVVGYWAGPTLRSTAEKRYESAALPLRLLAGARSRWLDWRAGRYARSFATHLVTDPFDPRLGRLRNVVPIVPCAIRAAELPTNLPSGKGSERLRVVFAGRLAEYKGLTDLVTAVDSVADTVGIELTVAGAGPLEEWLVDRAKDDERIYFVGALEAPEVSELLQKADVLSLPSYAEGSPKVIVEAFASGAAVVASRVNGIPAMISDRCNGLLHDPGDVAALTHHLECLARDASLRQRLANNALLAAHNHTFEVWVESLSNALRLADEVTAK